MRYTNSTRLEDGTMVCVTKIDYEEYIELSFEDIDYVRIYAVRLTADKLAYLIEDLTDALECLQS